MKDQLEAILFAAGRFVDEDFIAKLLSVDIRKVRKGLAELKADYDQKAPETALQVVQEDKSWKLHVQDKYLDVVSRLVSDKEIAKTVLETLAICAWKNPITQAELIKYRGPAAYEHVAELMERGFLTKTPEGRSFRLNITDKFFEYFDVEGREDIRKLFSQVAKKAEEQQAVVDKEKQEYAAQKTLAEATAKALEEGREPPEPEDLTAENSPDKSSAHSAKNNLKDLLSETTEELKKFQSTVDSESEALQTMNQPEEKIPEESDGQLPKESTDDLIKEAREELAEFAEDIDKLKVEKLEHEEKVHHKREAAKHAKSHDKGHHARHKSAHKHHKK